MRHDFQTTNENAFTASDRICDLEARNWRESYLPNVPVYAVSLRSCLPVCVRRCLCLYKDPFLKPGGNERHLPGVLSWPSFLKCSKSCISSPAATVESVSHRSLPNPRFVVFLLSCN